MMQARGCLEPRVAGSTAARRARLSAHAAAHAARRVVAVGAIRLAPAAGRRWRRLGKVHGRIGPRRRQLIEEVVEARRPRVAPREEVWQAEQPLDGGGDGGAVVLRVAERLRAGVGLGHDTALAQPR